MTYEELLQEVCKTANILKSFGVKKGDVSCSLGYSLGFEADAIYFLFLDRRYLLAHVRLCDICVYLILY